MSNSSSSAENPFTSALGNAAGAVDPRTSDPDFKMRYSSVRTLGTNVRGYGENLSQLSSSTRAIDLHTLTFGVIGGGLNVAHRAARDSAAEALKQAKDVLESWKEALNTAADNTEAAEQASKAPQDGGGKIPQIKNPGGGLPSGGLGGLPKNTGGLGDLGKGGLGKGGIDPSDLGIDKPSTPDPSDIKQPEIPTPDPSDIKQPEVPTPDPSDIKQPDLNTPDPSDIKQPEIPTPSATSPDLSGLGQPKTDLAGLNPQVPATSTPQIRTPDLPSTSPGGTTVPRTTAGLPEGTFAGGSSSSAPASSGLGAPGSIARALNTGVPLYPPGGMGGAPAQDGKDRDRGPHAGEDEETWGLDVDHTVAVLGKEEV
ncbi:PE-PGRS virulence associated protein [[Actinomadura] parvosata subsp. kistnae]|uniref:type VII secretion target n=1 Tax=[Actinomadura] parvosata TaxID=1955412 RepID=UPI000D2B2F95|nr:PE-PGRS virulence associated protein [Actinomadura parvosata subsp. kistnae]